MGEMISMDGQEIILKAPHESSRPLELPSARDVPLMRDLGRMGIDKFMNRFAVPTQTDDRGFVDYGWLLGYVHSLVPDDHVWSGTPDVHHLQWTAESYKPRYFNEQKDPELPDRFREMPFHKLLIPRDLHDLIHVVTLPSPTPSYEVMGSRLAAYDTAISLFEKAKQTIEVANKEQRLVPAPHPDYSHKTYDPVSKKLIEREVLIDKYWSFYNQFKKHLSETDQQDVDDLIDLSVIKSRDPVFSVISSLDRAVRPHKPKQGIRPKVRWQSKASKRAA